MLLILSRSHWLSGQNKWYAFSKLTQTIHTLLSRSHCSCQFPLSPQLIHTAKGQLIQGANFHISFSWRLCTWTAAVSLTQLTHYGCFLLIYGQREFQHNSRNHTGNWFSNTKSWLLDCRHDDFLLMRYFVNRCDQVKLTNNVNKDVFDLYHCSNNKIK